LGGSEGAKKAEKAFGLPSEQADIERGSEALWHVFYGINGEMRANKRPQSRSTFC